MLIGRQSSLSEVERRPPPRMGAPGRGWTRVLRGIAYALLGMLGVAAVLTLALLLLARRPPPARLAEAPARAAPHAPKTDVAPPAAPSAAGPAAADAADPQAALQAVRTQVESETAVLAALRNRADQGRQELADLQRQQDAAHADLANLQRQHDTLQAELADLQRQQQAAQADLLRRRQEAKAQPATPAAPGTAARPGATTPALDQALDKPRQPAPARADEATRQRSPPPAYLGRVPTDTIDNGAPRGVWGRPRVFVQYRAGSMAGQDEATEMARRLLFSDFAYAEALPVPASTTVPVIRFFHREDAEAAQHLADLLRGGGVDFRVLDGSGQPGPASGAIEVWIP